MPACSLMDYKNSRSWTKQGRVLLTYSKWWQEQCLTVEKQKKFSNGHHNIREPRLRKRLLLLAENYNVPQEKSTKRSQMLNLPLPSGERAGQPHYNATRPSKIKVNKTQVTQKN